MGYYVNIEECYSPSDVLIKKEKFDEAYKNLCWLNTDPDFDVMKSGGAYGGEVDKKSTRPDGLDYHPAKWYSWMPADYHVQYKTLHEILKGLGFDYHEDEKGINALWYNSKTGNEDIFLCALAYYIEDGSYIIWSGEEGEKWKHTFKDGRMFYHTGKVVYKTTGSLVTLSAHKKNAEREELRMQEMMKKWQQEQEKSTK